MNLVAIDPGKHASGIAVFGSSLLVAAYYTNDPFVLSWVAEHTPVIVELPQVYVVGKGDPNDLIALAFAAGRITRRFSDVDTVKPAQWKGQLPKEVHHRRVRACLESAELDAIENSGIARGKLHNALDAVALGLWKLGRA